MSRWGCGITIFSAVWRTAKCPETGLRRRVGARPVGQPGLPRDSHLMGRVTYATDGFDDMPMANTLNLWLSLSWEICLHPNFIRTFCGESAALGG